MKILYLHPLFGDMFQTFECNMSEKHISLFFIRELNKSMKDLRQGNSV